MGTLGWLLLVAIAIALGFSVGRLWPGSAARITELERERDLAHADLRNYRTEVTQHFERTAELFDKVTADYRSLYEHLAVSARQLGAIRGESVGPRLVEPERRSLGDIPPADAATPGDPVDASTDEPPPSRLPRDYDELPEIKDPEDPDDTTDAADQTDAAEESTEVARTETPDETPPPPTGR